MPEDSGTVENDAQDSQVVDPGTEAQAPDTPADNYQQRYEDLRPQYDRTMAQVQQYEQFINSLQDPETQADALRALGLELSQEEEDALLDLEDDGELQYDPRVDQLVEAFNAQQEEAQYAQLQEVEAEFLDQAIGAIESKEGGQLSDSEVETLVQLADRMRDEDGIPDVEAAYQQMKTVAEALNGRYLESKRASRLNPGTAGTESVDLSDPATLDKIIEETAAAAMEAEQG